MDWEDPDITAATYLYEWETSEAGQWVMEHAVDQPEWQRMQVPVTLTYHFMVIAKLLAKDYTFWQLKWGTAS